MPARTRRWLYALGSLTASMGMLGTSLVSADNAYNAHDKRDPFVALVQNGRLVTVDDSAIPEETLPSLGGILWDVGGHSIALLNGTEAKVGDKIDRYRVKEIRQDAVVLALEDGRLVVLQMGTGAELSAPKPTTQGQGRRYPR